MLREMLLVVSMQNTVYRLLTVPSGGHVDPKYFAVLFLVNVML